MPTYKLLDQPVEQKEETTGDYLTRNIGAPIARSTERFFGAPADLLQLGGSLASAVLPESVTSLPGKAVDLLHLGIKKALPSYGAASEKENTKFELPTSTKLREITKKITGDTLEPQTENEERWSTAVADLVDLVNPASLGGKLKFGRALALTTTGNVAAKLAHELGFGETGEAVSKLGVMGITGLLGGRKQLTNKMGQLYDTVEKSIPEGNTVSSKGLSHALDELTKFSKSGDINDANRTFIASKVGSVKNHIKRGRIPTQEVWNLKKDLNSQFATAPIDSKGQKQLGKLIGSLNETLDTAGKSGGIDISSLRQADDIWKGLHDSWAITDWLKNHVRFDTLKNPLLKLAIGYPLYHTYGAQGVLAAGAAGVGVREVTKFANFLAKSPQARKHYKGMLTAALKKSPVIASREAAKLDKEITDYENEQFSQGKFKLLDPY